LHHEPLIALTSDNGSKSFYEIALQAIFSLKPGGKIIFEHGYSQAKEVSDILKECGFNNVVSNKDFQGLDRYTYANK
jgi:release factor glutamine methyltransferase